MNDEKSGVPHFSPLLREVGLFHYHKRDQGPSAHLPQLSEARLMIEARRLYSLGIGLTDAHLIASAFLNPPTLLWTTDKRLRKAAERLGISRELALVGCSLRRPPFEQNAKGGGSGRTARTQPNRYSEIWPFSSPARYSAITDTSRCPSSHLLSAALSAA